MGDKDEDETKEDYAEDGVETQGTPSFSLTEAMLRTFAGDVTYQKGGYQVSCVEAWTETPEGILGTVGSFSVFLQMVINGTLSGICTCRRRNCEHCVALGLRILEWQEEKQGKLIAYNGTPLFAPEYTAMNDLENLLRIPIPLHGENELRKNSVVWFTARNGHVTTLHLNDVGLMSLPKTLGNLKSLEVLDVEENKLTTLPETITRLKSLRVLNLKNNLHLELGEELQEKLKNWIINLQENDCKIGLPRSLDIDSKDFRKEED